jgi:hypothetical protein
MPLQNRVTPRGQIVCASERGTLMGNRGVLHGPTQRIIRPWQLIRWISCVTEFRGRRRPGGAPGGGGHRPCAHCRHADYQRFRRAWSAARGLEPASAEAIDRVLHEERLIGRREQRTHVEPRVDLPDGAIVSLDGEAYLVRADALLPWSFGGYGVPRAGPLPASVEVLTPRSAVDALRGGYVAELHPSAVR